MKKAFSLVEIGFVLFIMASVFFIVMPLSVSNIKQAKFISGWKEYMEQVLYSYETLIEYKKTNNLNNYESVKRLLHYMDAEPYIEMHSLSKYKYKMMNGDFSSKMNIKKSDDVYYDTSGRLIWVEYRTGVLPYATVWVDLNGKNKPNIVGKDIFVYEVYNDYVSPYGNNLKMDSIKNDCSKIGTGMSCSQYYILGGDLK